MSFKPHFFTSLLIGSWLFLFIILIKPFQIEALAFSRFMTMATGYSLIAVLGYLIIVPIQNKIFIKINKWNLKLEIAFILVFYLLTLIPSYLYHKSDFTHGLYNLKEFIIYIFIPSSIILTPLIIFARIHLIILADKTDDYIVIKGAYKLDYLKIKSANLVCISSSKNYVEVYYLEDEVLSKKLIRTSLKKVENDIPSLMRVHRSHLINPNHLCSWVNNKTLSLTQIEIPISKKYKERINAL